ncbi:RNA polymerase sigma factor [Agarilytica rhodophyticola]|uniref:RNA polymerase sigma factor n=1 Tax=Agarilytica rhodophyticola TaxID=1737490 RepID=UPI000B3464BC|nr:RNA polymerase sigma factor [Agarilytica rhodophyticola]
MDESTLIKAAQAGDRSAFEQLLESRYDSIYRFAIKWSGNPTDAEDIAQQACVKLAGGIKQFNFESSFSTWLYRLVINCAKDWQRQQRKHSENEELDIQLAANDSGTQDKSDVPIYLRQVLQWVEQLGEEFKETLVLVFGEGLSHGEAAAVLEVKESTISWRIHNVRKKLSLLEDEEGSVR